MRKLHELAHCRAGDKGDTSILSLIAYWAEDYPLPALWALQFVCDRSLNGGVTTSLALDAHGKSLSYALLEMSV